MKQIILTKLIFVIIGSVLGISLFISSLKAFPSSQLLARLNIPSSNQTECPPCPECEEKITSQQTNSDNVICVDKKEYLETVDGIINLGGELMKYKNQVSSLNKELNQYKDQYANSVQGCQNALHESYNQCESTVKMIVDKCNDSLNRLYQEGKNGFESLTNECVKNMDKCKYYLNLCNNTLENITHQSFSFPSFGQISPINKLYRCQIIKQGTGYEVFCY